MQAQVLGTHFFVHTDSLLVQAQVLGTHLFVHTDSLLVQAQVLGLGLLVEAQIFGLHLFALPFQAGYPRIQLPQLALQ